MNYLQELEFLTPFQIVKKKVEDILIAIPEARQDDKLLIIEFLKRCGFDFGLSPEDIRRLPAFSSITRARRVIQYNEGRLQPEDNEIFERRRKGAKLAEKKFTNSKYTRGMIEENKDLDVIQKHIYLTVPKSQIKKVRDPYSELNQMHDALLWGDKKC